MAREKDGFRDCMEMLNERFPDKDLLNIEETMRFTGMSRNTVKKKIRFNPVTKRVAKTDLARQVCL